MGQSAVDSLIFFQGWNYLGDPGPHIQRSAPPATASCKCHFQRILAVCVENHSHSHLLLIHALFLSHARLTRPTSCWAGRACSWQGFPPVPTQEPCFPRLEGSMPGLSDSSPCLGTCCLHVCSAYPSAHVSEEVSVTKQSRDLNKAWGLQRRKRNPSLTMSEAAAWPVSLAGQGESTEETERPTAARSGPSPREQQRPIVPWTTSAVHRTGQLAILVS